MFKLFKHTILALAICSTSSAFAQGYQQILQSVDKNSVRLAALRQQLDADKAERRVDMSLENPEVELGYLFGNHGIGNRIDASVSQSFSLPQVYSQRRKLNRSLEQSAELEYDYERQQLLMKARQLCVEIIYCNALIQHIETDLNEARSIAEAYSKLYEAGEATVLDYNKTQQSVLAFDADYRECQTNRDNLLAQLIHLNGGNKLDVTDKAYTHTPLPKNIDDWKSQMNQKSIANRLAESQLQSQQQSLQLAKSETLPSFALGYMIEQERDDHYQGITLGISLPIWSGKKKVKAAKAQIEASRLYQLDVQQEERDRLNALFNEASQLQSTMNQYTSQLNRYNSSNVLRKAFDAGQISLITYIDELQWGHELREKQLQVERDYELKVSELLFGEY